MLYDLALKSFLRKSKVNRVLHGIPFTCLLYSTVIGVISSIIQGGGILDDLIVPHLALDIQVIIKPRDPLPG